MNRFILIILLILATPTIILGGLGLFWGTTGAIIGGTIGAVIGIAICYFYN